MSAQENKRLMQEIYARVAAGAGSMFVEHLADDVVQHVTGQYSWSQTFTGKESVLRELYGQVRSVIQPPIRSVASNFIAEGDCVVVQARGDMTNKQGVRYENDYCLIYRLRDGKIVEITEYLDSILCERVLGKFPRREASAA